MIRADITYDTRRKTWIVDAEFVAPTRGHLLVVPEGFETDLASIPRALWSIVAPHELSLPAPIVHDWLYRHGGTMTDRCTGIDCDVSFTKGDADRIFLDLMTQEGVSWWKRQAAYRAVQWFGGASWNAKAGA